MKSFVIVLIVTVFSVCQANVYDVCKEVCKTVTSPTDSEDIKTNKRNIHDKCFKHSKTSVMHFQSCRQGIEWVALESCAIGCEKNFNDKKISNLPVIGDIRAKCEEKKHQGPGNELQVACKDGIKGGVQFFSLKGKGLRTQVDVMIESGVTVSSEEAIEQTVVKTSGPTGAPTYKPTKSPTLKKTTTDTKQEVHHSTLENLETLGKNLKHKLDSLLHKKEKSADEAVGKTARFEDDIYDELE